jgi:hypothetical protein
MIRKILILGSVLAMAGVAQAAPVNVSLQGKSEEAVRIDLLKAAKKVCKEASDPLTTDGDYWDCVADTYSDALHKLHHALSTNASAAPMTTKVASR